MGDKGPEVLDNLVKSKTKGSLDKADPDSSYAPSQRTDTQEPTSVGMAEGKTGLGRRQLVEIVQSYHIRHLKLGLTRETEGKNWRK